MGIFSYVPLFKAVAKNYRPTNILEWGPGQSTRLLLDLFPNTPILSVEHNKKYYTTAKADFEKFDNVKLVYAPINPAASTGYVTIPLEYNMTQEPKQYDFIFVDGRERHSCLVVAKLLSSGIVVIHDAERKAYASAYPLYRFCVICNNEGTQTAILSDTVDITSWILD